MIRKSSYLVLLIAVVLLSGCASSGQWKSQEIAQIKTNDAQMLAEDVVEILLTEYVAGETTFALSSGKTGNFGTAIETKLREVGYAVAVDGEKNPEKPLSVLNMSYILDELGEAGSYRLSVRVEPQNKIGQLYQIEQLYQIDSSGEMMREGVTIRDESDHTDTLDIATNRTLKKKSALGADIDTSWNIQVMAGVNLDDLERHQGQITGLGYEAHLIHLDAIGRFQALRIGPFKTVREARQVKHKIRDQYANAFLVEPKK